jgi:D-alanyl-D-alanine carboxypeptidase
MNSIKILGKYLLSVLYGFLIIFAFIWLAKTFFAENLALLDPGVRSQYGTVFLGLVLSCSTLLTTALRGWIGMIGVVVASLLAVLGLSVGNTLGFGVIGSITICFAVLVSAAIGWWIFEARHKEIFTKTILINSLRSNIVIRSVISGIIIIGLLWFAATKLFGDFESVGFLAVFAKKFPQNSSMIIVEDGLERLSYNSDRVVPIASVIKISIALAYAKSLTTGVLQAEDRVLVSELDRWWIPGTDGGAHEAWKRELKLDDSKDSTVVVSEIVRGMIVYSSNANTEYLLDRLGLQAVDSVMMEAGIKQSPMFYFVSSLLVGSEYNWDIKTVSNLSEQDYYEKSKLLHMQLKENHANVLSKIPSEGIPLAIQKNWSSRLPSTTAREYSKLLQKMLDRKLISDSIDAKLENILIAYSINLKSLYDPETVQGGKAGSTGYIYTKAIFSKDYNTKKTIVLVYFFNDIDSLRVETISSAAKEFDFKILFSDSKKRDATITFFQ